MFKGYFSHRQDTTNLKVVCLNKEANYFSVMRAFKAVPDVTPLDAYDLPGRGTPRDDCGQMRLFGCSDCGHVFEAARRCDQKTCPDCWRRWAFKAGKRAGLRTWAAWRLVMKKKYGGRRGRLMHIVISMKYEGGNIDAYRQRAYKICEQHEITGGCAVFHHTRDNSGSEERIPDGYVHYHIIGLAPRGIIPGTEGGDIFHVIRDSVRDNYKGFQRTREVIACISYLLTHCGVKEKSHSITYFGDIAYNKLSNQALKEAVPGMMDYLDQTGRQCPCCGGRDCHSMWDAEAMIDYKEQTDRFYNPEPAPALELYGVEIT